MRQEAKIFLALSLIGILLLLFLSFYLPPKTLEISEISERMAGKRVQVEGRIVRVKDFSSSGFQLLTLQDNTGSITVTAFSKSVLNASNKTCVVTGRVSEYNKEVQIEAEKIISS